MNEELPTTPPTYSAKVERNSRGVTWSVHIDNCLDADDLMLRLDDLTQRMAMRYGKMVVDDN